MNLRALFPLVYVLSLSNRDRRREQATQELNRYGFQHEVLTAVEPEVSPLKDMYMTDRKAALASSKLVALFNALSRKQNVLIFEDDIRFRTDFWEHSDSTRLPADWKALYLGGLHRQPAVPVSNSLSRAVETYDNHAIGVRFEFIPDVIDAIINRNSEIANPSRFVKASDVQIAKLQPLHPIYAFTPNLVWQTPHVSDTIGLMTNNYDEEGRQRFNTPEEWEAANQEYERKAREYHEQTQRSFESERCGD